MLAKIIKNYLKSNSGGSMQKLTQLIKLYHRAVQRLLVYQDLLQYYQQNNNSKAQLYEKNARDLEKGLDRILQRIEKQLEILSINNLKREVL